MAAADFTFREGSGTDLTALVALDSSFNSEWVLYLERHGGAIEQTVDLRWRKARPAGSHRQFETSVERLARHLSRSECLVIGETNGDVAGYLMLATNWWNQTAEVVEVLVDLNYRGQGLGKLFVELAETFARERRLRALQWEAQNDNRHAIEFACSQGFRIAGFHDAYYENRGYERQDAVDSIGLAIFLTRELD
jgi:ribosomal protein S18 acetylase RimI-like enzyme